jgi:3-hydroxyacyl-[acyl-carrier-protein] dehydratase
MSDGKSPMQLALDDILRAIPHRPPFLLLDRVHSMEPSAFIVATRLLRNDDPWFAGHFPGHPVFPGVLIVEALAQAGAVLAAHSDDADMARHVPYLVNIENARVIKPVRPGQQLELRVNRTRAWGTFWRLKGDAFVDGELVASASLMAALVPRDAMSATASPGAAASEPSLNPTFPFLDIAHAGA